MKPDEFGKALGSIEAPVCIVSTRVGKGNVSVAEALRERLRAAGQDAVHVVIEDLLPEGAVHEDLERYKFISDKLTFLLNLVYRIPFFYFRKRFRETFAPSDLDAVRAKLQSLGVRSLICVSHRPSFWITALKRRHALDWKVWGVLTEFGPSLGWKYIFWEALDAYLSPVPIDGLRLRLPAHVRFLRTPLLAKSEFYALADAAPDPHHALFAAGFWGQVRAEAALSLVDGLLREFPQLTLHVVCGTNRRLHDAFRARFIGQPRLIVYGELLSLAPVMKRCACVITKPGFSTIVEAHAAGRPIFLLKGMPVAEDHNADFAVRHLGAQFFRIEDFRRAYYGWAGRRGAFGVLAAVRCPSCGAGETAPVIEDYDRLTRKEGLYSLVRCVPCGLRYVNPRPREEEIGEFYPDSYPAYRRPAPGNGGVLWRAWRSFRLSAAGNFIVSKLLGTVLVREIDLSLVSLGPKSGTLDVGCSTGAYANGLKRLTGCEAWGVEINESARQRAQELLGPGHVFADLSRAAVPAASLDLITMWFVFEHLWDPGRALDDAARLLKPGKWLVMGVPNSESWAFRIFGRYWSALELPRHLQSFSPSTLSGMLDRHEFEVRRVRHVMMPYSFTGSLQLWMRGKRSGAMSKSPVFSLENNLFLKLAVLPVYLVAVLFGRSDMIVVYARKKGKAEGAVSP